MSASNIIAELPLLTWRDLDPVPCDIASYDFSHAQARREYPYINGFGHEWMGRDSVVINARLYFTNTHFDRVLYYPDVWGRWRSALLEDGTPGDLVHPDLGTIEAVCLSGKVQIVSQVRSGIIVDVTFEEHQGDPEEAVLFTVPTVDPGALAKAADAATAAYKLNFPEEDTGLTDLFSAWESIKGQLFSASLSITGAVNRMMGTVASLVEDFEALNSNDAHPVLSVLKRLWSSLEDFKKLAESNQRTTAKKVVGNDTTLPTFAGEVGNTLNEIMGLNLGFLKKPKVPKGSTLLYYT
jgi:prophage DNA circulation protein